MPTTYSITLTRDAQEDHDLGNLQGFFFKVTASNAVGQGLDNAVIRVLREPLDPIAQTTKDTYNGIITPADLIDLPVGEPNNDSDNRFRVDAFDFVYDSVIIGDEQWEVLKQDVEDLIRSLAANNRLIAQEVVNFSA